MDAAAKQQIVERVRQANNILVTVSTNPSVDQLAACIGLTLLLNRMEKHATAVFSGQIPSTLEFLQPEKTIETNTDSLRDFIISLDKEKADKLRYKIEDQVVKIFITPYKTSLSEKDLVFSQGEYNVEAVIALGIQQKAQIDAAITAHGRILHDATVICLNTGQGKAGDIGQINWQDPQASSLCEMIVSISESFGPGLIDNQMATAFLTGIVAETERFSNPKTSPKVMTMSAQLMAAGANQQLIVSKLEPVITVPKAATPAPKMAKPETLPENGTLNVEHEAPKAAEPSAKAKAPAKKPEPAPAADQEILIDEQGNILPTAASLAPKTEDKQPPQPQSPPPIQPLTQVSPPAKSEPPNPHAFLNPANQTAVDAGAFTANVQPEWEGMPTGATTDPLGGPVEQESLAKKEKKLVVPDEITMPAPNSVSTTPPNVDAARNAVQSALAGAPPPFDPNFEPPVDALNAAPDELANTPELPQPPQNKQGKDKAAPPPFPPPLTPIQGVVIPANPGSNAKK